MEKILILVLSAFVSTLTIAQDDACWGETEDQKTLCREAYGIWQGDRDQGSIDIAYESWLKVRGICPPCVSEKLYTEGAKYYSSFIKANKGDSVVQAPHVDSLLSMYSKRMEFFPKKTAYIQGKYGSQLFKYRSDQYNEAQKYLKPSIDDQKEKSAATAIQSYYYTIYKQYAEAVTQKDSTMKVEKKLELLKEFVRMSNYVDGGKELAKNEKQVASYEKVRKNLLKIFLQVESDCESLVELLKNNLIVEGEAESYKTALTILTLKECTDGDDYLNILQNSDNGTAKSAFSIGIILLKNEKYAEALEWMDKAVERCPDCEERVNYLKRAGQTANLNKATSKAKGYARQILEIDPKSGDAYLILADAWSNGNCSDDKFGKACAYWVSYDYYARAKSLDPEVAEKAQSSMNKVRQGWPLEKELFIQGVTKGSSYTCCGVTTTVRTRD